MTGGGPRIVLIHAVAAAMAPVHRAFADGWPEAALVNLLDDSLSGDRALDPGLTPAMARRIGALAAYGQATGADGVLFTCSAFGSAIDAAARDAAVPILKPNEAMFEAALDAGGSLTMLATFAPAVAGMEAEFAEQAAARGSDARLRTICVADAIAALRMGDRARHDGLLADAAGDCGPDETVLLAHFSTAMARPAVEAALGRPVLTAPDAAVARLRDLVLR